jgi:hypothetical protein
MLCRGIQQLVKEAWKFFAVFTRRFAPFAMQAAASAVRVYIAATQVMNAVL